MEPCILNTLDLSTEFFALYIKLMMIHNSLILRSLISSLHLQGRKMVELGRRRVEVLQKIQVISVETVSQALTALHMITVVIILMCDYIF